MHLSKKRQVPNAQITNYKKRGALVKHGQILCAFGGEYLGVFLSPIVKKK
jgi:hypothetical protein